MQKVICFLSLIFHNLQRSYRIILRSFIILILYTICYISCSFVFHSNQIDKKDLKIKDYVLCKLGSEISGNYDNIVSSINLIKDTFYESIKRTSIYKNISFIKRDLSNTFTKYKINITNTNKLTDKYSTINRLEMWRLNLRKLILEYSTEFRYQSHQSFNFIKSIFLNKINQLLLKLLNNIANDYYKFNLQKSIDNELYNKLNLVLSKNFDNIKKKLIKEKINFFNLNKKKSLLIVSFKRNTYKEIIIKKSFDIINLRRSKKSYCFVQNNSEYINNRIINANFIRFPIADKFRISSKFNLHRLNPVTGRISPHRGIDFAIPIGTPVLAVENGEVVVSKKDNAAGNYVVIRHDDQHTTRYMHLKTLLVKTGQKVKKGDKIALSGNTGWSTGPHLHYEVWINQKAVNPLTAKFPDLEKQKTNYKLSKSKI